MWADEYYKKNGIYPETLLLYWVEQSPGAFYVGMFTKNDPEQEMMYITKCEKLVEDGVLNHWGSKRGWYIPRRVELKEIDYINADDKALDIWLPFGLSDYVELYENSVVIVAGAYNAGKTTVLLNMIAENQQKNWDISYFNSEMSGGELKKRLSKFEYSTLSDWKFKAYERAEDFQDVVMPGKNSLNIIDFLEVHDEFYIIGRKIKEIHDRLNGGVAVIALQKNAGRDEGMGGSRSMEVARLALALDYGRVKVTKAKNFKQENKNPNGLVKDFKIVNGSQIIDRHPWYREGK